MRQREVAYLIATALASLAVVSLIAFARLAGSPRELRKLRVLAVLLPSAFVLLVQLILYFLEVDDRITEVGEHVIGGAILSVGAVPFSVYVFRAFTRLRDELARRAQHLETLHETSMAMTRAPALLYERIADGARGVVRADWGVVSLEPTGRGRILATAPRAGGLPSWEAGLVDEAGKAGRPIRRSHGERSFLGTPIRLGEGVLGVMAAIRDSGPGFVVEDELLLGMFSVAASAGIENAQRLEDTHLLATVEERERVARELHDDLGQLLAFLTAKIQAIEELIATGQVAGARRELAGLENASRALGEQVREAILGLRARIGPGSPLGPALEEYVSEFGIQAGLSTSFESTPDAGRSLPGAAQYQLMRIAQEALTNVRRHARAHRVAVRLAESGGRVELSVTDDGVGFDPSSASRGFGLKTMEERTESLNGSFEIRSSPGAGTCVLVRAPVAR
ncbi:MAG: GAF domain-containing sensor histidine kinase [Acidobacteria bacterium]|nr:GAF domain-containing sensor histidine kinase [Acidobacteriota bacterium]